MNKKEMKDAQKVCRIFKQANRQCFVVGGAVRNRLMGLAVTDIDMATDAKPEEVMKMFPVTIPTGVKHGTITVLRGGRLFEITTYRSDGGYSNQRHPDRVDFVPSITEDLKRRDFTINAIAFNPLTGESFDPHNGQQDIKKRIIKAIGNPEERFTEDGLRLLRACRFAAQLEFNIEEKTLDAMRKCGKGLCSVSAERIRDEINGMLAAGNPARAFQIMDKTGLLQIVLPELTAVKNLGEKGPLKIDTFEHSLATCAASPIFPLEARLAALFHDLGKAESFRLGDDDQIENFHKHEVYSEKIAVGIMERLRFSKKTIQKTASLIRNHMFEYRSDFSDAALRRMIIRIGKDNLRDQFTLRRADFLGALDGREFPAWINEAEKRLEAIIDSRPPLSIKDLAINGHILHARGHLPKDRRMGRVMEFLHQTVLDDPNLNQTDKLLEMAVKFYNQRLNVNSDL